MVGRVERFVRIGRRRVELSLLLVGLFWWYVPHLPWALSVDEVHYARSGWLFFHGDPYANVTHIFAPTAKYFIGFGELLFGATPLGARAPVLVFGLLTVALAYELGVSVDGRPTGFLAALLLGVTYPFAHRSVMALLDVPLTFFFLALLYVILRWLDDPTHTRALLIGVLSAALVTTKAYGLLYAAAPLVAVVVVAARRVPLSDLPAALRYHVAGGLGALAVVYAPFALVSHPPVAMNLPPLVEFALRVPLVGNLLYVFGAAVKYNLLHIGSGHAVTIGSTLYQYPPVWTYVYWLFQWGTVFVVLLAVVAVTTLASLVRRTFDREFVLQASVVVPFVALSLMTVKFDRYVLPLLPLLLVLGIAAARRVLDRLSTALGTHRREGLPADVLVPAVLVVLVLGLGLVPPSPVATSMETSIRTDSGYDHAADVVEACSVADELVVLSYHSVALDYYLTDDHRERVTLVPFTPYDVQNETKYRLIHDRLRAGEVHAVVTEQTNPRLRRAHPDLYRYIREEGELQTAIEQSPDGELHVYTFGGLRC